jgi:hypothetical protein
MGFSKSDAYAAEEPPPERQFPDLLSNQTISPDRDFERPPEAVPRVVPGRAPPRRYRRRPQAWPSVILLIGVALVIGSLLAGWWAYTVQEPNNGGTIQFQFLLGSQYSVTCSGGSDCAREPTGTLSYGSENLGSVGNLYGGALALMLGALVAGIAAAAVGLLGALGYWVSRRQSLVAVLLTLVTFGLALGATVSVAALQPAALQQGGGGIAPGGSPSPASSFWGSCSASGLNNGACSSGTGTITAQWGASAGWYLALFACVALLVALVLHLVSRPVRGQAVAGRRSRGP